MSMPSLKPVLTGHTYIYTVAYIMWASAMPKYIEVIASDKWAAYDRATYEVIPAVEKKCPYAAWVESVKYRNGKEKRFNTFAGKPI